jgi:endonuclease-3 related protein
MTMNRDEHTFASAVERIMDAYDVDGWWPHESRFEIMVGAILVQRTRWENVKQVITVMKSKGMLSTTTLATSDIHELEDVVRPAGFFRQKALRIQRLAHYIQDHHNGDVAGFLDQPADMLASDLERIKGIGPETRDAILLYAANHPVIIVDTYALRLCGRLGLLEPATPRTIKNHLMTHLPTTPHTCMGMHAAIVEHCKRYCTSTPRCAACPLIDMCKQGAPT